MSPPIFRLSSKLCLAKATRYISQRVLALLGVPLAWEPSHRSKRPPQAAAMRSLALLHLCDFCGTISRCSPSSLWGVSAPIASLSLLSRSQAADWSVEALTAAAAAARAIAGGSTVDGVDAVTCSCSHRSSAASVWRRMLGGGCCSSATPFAAWLAPSAVSTPAAALALNPVVS